MGGERNTSFTPMNKTTGTFSYLWLLESIKISHKTQKIFNSVVFNSNLQPDLPFHTKPIVLKSL